MLQSVFLHRFFLHRVFSIVFSGFGGQFLWCWFLYSYITVTFSIFFVSRSMSFAIWNRWPPSIRNSQYFLYLPFKLIVIHYFCWMVFETKHLFLNFVVALCMEKIMIMTEKGHREIGWSARSSRRQRVLLVNCARITTFCRKWRQEKGLWHRRREQTSIRKQWISYRSKNLIPGLGN